MIRQLCLRRTILAICFALASVCTHGIAAEFTILADKVKVTATQEGVPNDFMFALTVAHGDQRFTLSTALTIGVRNQQDAIMAMKKTMGWKGDYLFIREECGGGNIWRCNLNHVFALREGRLIYIGEVAGEERIAPCPSFKDGYFIDVYDKLECNDLTCHARAPAIRLIMKEKRGRFHVVLQRTWQANLQQFLENMAEIREMLANAHEEPPELSGIADLLLFNAALAKYCKRHKEFDQIIRMAQAGSSEKGKQILQILAEVVPGELPANTGGVRQLHIDTRMK